MTIERGTTQTIKISIKGWDLTSSDIYVTFKQGTRKLTRKDITDVTYSNRTSVIHLTLSQQETMQFKESEQGLVQVRWIGEDGFAHKTKTAPFNVDKLLYEAGVFITPGFIFGKNGENYIRISLCSKPEVLKRAAEKIRRVCR